MATPMPLLERRSGGAGVPRFLHIGGVHDSPESSPTEMGTLDFSKHPIQRTRSASAMAIVHAAPYNAQSNRSSSLLSTYLHSPELAPQTEGAPRGGILRSTPQPTGTSCRFVLPPQPVREKHSGGRCMSLSPTALCSGFPKPPPQRRLSFAEPPKSPRRRLSFAEPPKSPRRRPVSPITPLTLSPAPSLFDFVPDLYRSRTSAPNSEYGVDESDEEDADVASEASDEMACMEPAEFAASDPCEEWAVQADDVPLGVPQRAHQRASVHAPTYSAKPQSCTNDVTERLVRATEKLVVHSRDSDTERAAAHSVLTSPTIAPVPMSDYLLSSATTTTPATPHSRTAVSPLFASSPVVPRAPPSVAVSLASVSRDLVKMP